MTKILNSVTSKVDIDLNDISTPMIKMTQECLVSHMRFIINQYFTKRKFQNRLKASKVKHLSKKDNKLIFDRYRSVDGLVVGRRIAAFSCPIPVVNLPITHTLSTESAVGLSF